MKMISVGPIEGSVRTFVKKVERSLASLEGPPQVAIMYLPIQARHEEYLTALESVVRVPVVGATTGGAAFTERGATKAGAVCAVLSGEDLEVSIAIVRDLHTDPAQRVRAAMRDLDDSTLSSQRGGRTMSLMVLADAFACDGEELVACLRQNIPPHCRVFGGTAGDDWKFTGTRVFTGRKSHSDAAVLVRLMHRQRVNMDVLHGLRAVEGGRDLTITDIERNVLRALDGRPAATVYEEELRRLKLMSGTETVLQVMAKYELGTRTPFGEELKIRAPLGIVGKGEIRLASSLAKGQVVRVVAATSDRLIQAARVLSARVLDPLPAISGALVFDCAMRLQMLGHRYGEEVRAFMAPIEHPLLGMTCYGEIAKFGGNVEGFHNNTAVMVGW